MSTDRDMQASFRPRAGGEVRAAALDAFDEVMIGTSKARKAVADFLGKQHATWTP